jgi:gliding motility-associated-like protein
MTEQNFTYCISLRYSISELQVWDLININRLVYKPIQLGAILTDTIVKRYLQPGVAQPLNICAIPNFETSLVPYKDTVNWIHVQGNFKAKGGERYLTIGNFECNPTAYNPDSVAVYIYIDDVRLYKCNPDSNLHVDSLIIPNIFTPNGDGTNDRFEYKNQEQWEFETLIFNRWEVPVYHNKTSKNWDGTFEGNKVSPGVYFYIIKARAIQSGKEVNYRGTVTVMY